MVQQFLLCLQMLPQAFTRLPRSLWPTAFLQHHPVRSGLPASTAKEPAGWWRRFGLLITADGRTVLRAGY